MPVVTVLEEMVMGSAPEVTVRPEVPVRLEEEMLSTNRGVEW